MIGNVRRSSVSDPSEVAPELLAKALASKLGSAAFLQTERAALAVDARQGAETASRVAAFLALGRQRCRCRRRVLSWLFPRALSALLGRRRSLLDWRARLAAKGPALSATAGYMATAPGGMGFVGWVPTEAQVSEALAWIPWALDVQLHATEGGDGDELTRICSWKPPAL